jgi:hypothetical protein
VLVIHLLAAGMLGILGWGIFVLISPYRTCRWCRRKTGGRPRCWRCKGTRLTRRLGAYHVHKVKLSLIQAWDEREWWR